MWSVLRRLVCLVLFGKAVEPLGDGASLEEEVRNQPGFLYFQLKSHLTVESD